MYDVPYVHEMSTKSRDIFFIIPHDNKHARNDPIIDL